MPDPPEERSSSRPLGPGGRLAEARERKGIPLDDVVGFLKYGLRQFEALEADHYDALPPAAVVRGMVRGYAKFLGMDPAPLLDDLRLILTAPPPEVSAPVMDVPFQNKRRGVHWVWWTVPALVALALVAFGVEHFIGDGPLFKSHGFSLRNLLGGGSSAPPPASAPRAAEAGGAVVALADGGLPVGQDGATAAAPGPGGTAAGSTAAGSTAAGGMAPSGMAPGGMAPGGNTTAAPASAAARPVNMAGSASAVAAAMPVHAATRRLEMRCDNRSWVEVRSGDGQILVSQVLDAGTNRIVEGRPPFNVVIGAAHGVALTYQGERVNLAPYTVVDVARLSLN
jgi:cytoskeleton protein RodZ